MASARFIETQLFCLCLKIDWRNPNQKKQVEIANTIKLIPSAKGKEQTTNYFDI